jgi:hypothetical protein
MKNKKKTLFLFSDGSLLPSIFSSFASRIQGSVMDTATHPVWTGIKKEEANPFLVRLKQKYGAVTSIKGKK